MSARISRRTLMGGAAAFALGCHGHRTSANAVRTIDLEVREMRWELAPGRVVKAMAYNGQIPGPEIRAREGERLRVVVKNALAEPTTVHWHGVDVPNAMDGVPGLTQPAIAPGATFTYEFDARPAGTRWYHTHFQEHRQMDLGLVAPFIIEPTQPEQLAVDRDVTLVLDDWTTGSGRPLPLTREGVAGGRGSMGGMMSRMRPGGMGGMMGGRRMGGAHTPPPYDTITINGKAYPSTVPLVVQEGERVRLRLINASAEHTHVVRLAGHRLRVTHTDGNPLQFPVEVDAVPMAPSERYDVVVVADRPGAWLLTCSQAGHAESGEQMEVRYRGHERATPQSPRMPGESVFWHYRSGRGTSISPPAGAAERRFDLVLSGGMGTTDRWTINNKVYPDTDRLTVAPGDRVIVSIRNHSPESHPMHLHGQSFRVLAVNGAALTAPLVKDSVDVEPHMGSVVIDLVAANPGDWLFHCHKPMHMEGGMASVLAVQRHRA